MNLIAHKKLKTVVVRQIFFFFNEKKRTHLINGRKVVETKYESLKGST